MLGDVNVWFVVWLLPAVLAGCSRSGSETSSASGSSAEVGPAASTEEPASAPAPASEPAPEPAPAPPKPILGWSTIPDRPTPEVDAHNREGLKLHRAGKYEEALTAFGEALALDDGYGWARYNRACALARLGRMDIAVIELERLLREDLPRFGPRVGSDEDLAPLRESPDGQMLAQLQSQLADAYLDVARSGIPAWIYRGRDEIDPATEEPRAPYQNLRLGVYDPGSRRFVALSPEVDRALGGVLDRERKRLLIVSGKIVQADMWVVQPVDIGVHLYDLGALGRPIQELLRIDRRHSETKDIRTAIAAAIDEGGDAVRLTYDDLGYAPGGLTLRIAGGKAEILAHTYETGLPELEKKFELLDREHVALDRRHVRIDRFGVQQHEPAPVGMDLDGGRLHIEGAAQAIELPSVHARVSATSYRVERTPDGRLAIVLTIHAECDGDEGGELVSYALSLVEIASGTATLLAEGEGIIAGAGLGRDGTVVLDDGERVVRFEPGSNRGIADVPDGVHFAVPSFDADCSI